MSEWEWEREREREGGGERISSRCSSNTCFPSVFATEDVYLLANLSVFNNLTCISCLAPRSSGLSDLRKSRLHMFESLIVLLFLLLIITVQLFLTSCLISAVILPDSCHVVWRRTIRQILGNIFYKNVYVRVVVGVIQKLLGSDENMIQEDLAVLFHWVGDLLFQTLLVLYQHGYTMLLLWFIALPHLLQFFFSLCHPVFV